MSVFIAPKKQSGEKRQHFRTRLKRARNQFYKTLYAQYRDEGLKGGSSRATRNALEAKRKQRQPFKHTHPDGFCGNVACKKCFADGPARPTRS